MKHLDLTVFEPGDEVGTLSKDGKVAVWTVTVKGELIPSDSALFVAGGDLIDSLRLSVRAYNLLKREGIHTIGEMMKVYDEQGVEGFDNMRNMGMKTRDEIVDHIIRLQSGNLRSLAHRAISDARNKLGMPEGDQ